MTVAEGSSQYFVCRDPVWESMWASVAALSSAWDFINRSMRSGAMQITGPFLHMLHVAVLSYGMQASLIGDDFAPAQTQSRY